MQIKTSSNLQNDYNTVSRLAHKSHEPIYITENGKEELVLMSLETYKEREQILKHRADVLEAEVSRLSGEKKYSISEVRENMKKIYSNEKK